ncbi:MAG TPA: hypothetical protein VFA59_17505 [Vicinamibacterales bacterium]|nr:hypothetical protein [Vicinamibacterales bacterium]
MRDYLGSVVSRRGHFRMESGYHADLWMDLETLCKRPDAIRPFARQLADRLRVHDVDAVCGPLNEGAFVALMVTEELGVDFTYAERIATASTALFPVRYELPQPLRPVVASRRVAIVNDVISAGSAVRGAYEGLIAAGATVVAIGALLVLGDAIGRFAGEHGVTVIALSREDYSMWTPDACPLCAAGVAISSITGDTQV